MELLCGHIYGLWLSLSELFWVWLRWIYWGLQNTCNEETVNTWELAKCRTMDVRVKAYLTETDHYHHHQEAWWACTHDNVLQQVPPLACTTLMLRGCLVSRTQSPPENELGCLPKWTRGVIRLTNLLQSKVNILYVRWCKVSDHLVPKMVLLLVDFFFLMQITL